MSSAFEEKSRLGETKKAEREPACLCEGAAGPLDWSCSRNGNGKERSSGLTQAVAAYAAASDVTDEPLPNAAAKPSSLHATATHAAVTYVSADGYASTAAADEHGVQRLAASRWHPDEPGDGASQRQQSIRVACHGPVDPHGNATRTVHAHGYGSCAISLNGYVLGAPMGGAPLGGAPMGEAPEKKV
eukprot:CAMPEP_0170465630 /NCGR_PEP_ID=MMETSP0123-20130129/9906_1 /TAXON_ID=182087 /ORGANISM="Favella ehrenbergii, Strain Fehren 1" /LENGTH=186 /DNA_ID=CAMNT_0010731583 /DNA_START=265 /DNA_END=828 /DNA_ORIENTATION=-